MKQVNSQDISITQCLTEDQKEVGYSLRHKVFVNEFEFEEPSPCGLEKDDYDEFAEHFLIRNVNTEEYIGYFRILPDVSHNVLGADFYRQEDRSEGTGISAEISRLLILPDYRARGIIVAILGFINDLLLVRGQMLTQWLSVL